MAKYFEKLKEVCPTCERRRIKSLSRNSPMAMNPSVVAGGRATIMSHISVDAWGPVKLKPHPNARQYSNGFVFGFVCNFSKICNLVLVEGQSADQLRAALLQHFSRWRIPVSITADNLVAQLKALRPISQRKQRI